jgi:hypothetical protein
MAFHDLLEVIYRQYFFLYSTDQLDRITKLADYYCALPVLSKALSGTLLDSHNFMLYIASDAFSLIKIAAKLQSSILFRECVIHLLGPFYDPVYKNTGIWDDSDKCLTKLKKLLDTAYNNVGAQIAEIDHALLNATHAAAAIDATAFEKAMSESATRCKTVDGNGALVVNLPEYYRNYTRLS